MLFIETGEEQYKPKGKRKKNHICEKRRLWSPFFVNIVYVTEAAVIWKASACSEKIRF